MSDFPALSGCSPLAAAVLRGHWDTARVILDIASQQYYPDVDEIEQDQNSLWRRTMDSEMPLDGSRRNDDKGLEGYERDEDDDDLDEYNSDHVADPQKLKIMDVSLAPTTVRCLVKPDVLLSSYNTEWIDSGGKGSRVGTLLHQAIVADDLNSFICIANLFDKVDPPSSLPEELLTFIISWDRPAILDEFIRRTGLGGPPQEMTKIADLDVDVRNNNPPCHPTRCVYHGLDVHGKKRKDLAAKGNPNAQAPRPRVAHVPLLWEAAKSGAVKIIDYLNTDRPCASYKTYATSHHGLLAQHVAKATENESSLRDWIGWTFNTLEESPLCAAVVGGSVEVLQKLFQLEPSFAQNALNVP